VGGQGEGRVSCVSEREIRCKIVESTLEEEEESAG
jgi:hypothetical protein